MLIEETEVDVEALPLAAFRAHLRLGTGFASDVVQDEVLEGFLRAAIAAVEARTGKALLARVFAWRIATWRDQSGQPLPVAPVSAVSDIVRIYSDGTEETVAEDLYRLSPDLHVPLLQPRGALLPVIPTGGAVRIRFTAGFASEWSGLPADIAQAVMLLAAHYYEYRGATGLGEGCMPFGVTSLLARYRNLRLFMGGAAAGSGR